MKTKTNLTVYLPCNPENATTPDRQYKEVSFDEMKEGLLPKGWHHFVDDLVNDLYNMGWDGVLMTMKPKFDEFRFEIAHGNDKIFDRIDEAENLSSYVCMTCGHIKYKPEDDPMGYWGFLCKKCDG